MTELENVTLCVPRPSSGLDPTEPVLQRSRVFGQLLPYQVVIKVDRFGFSANNITYQALGEHPEFRYFDFHSVTVTEGVSAHTYGLIPVWGFGVVVASHHPKISIGERVYGYFAMCKYLVLPVSPTDVNKYAFYVPRPHLPPDRRIYNQIVRCSGDPLYIDDPKAEDLAMLFRPLFWTSFWCEDWLSVSNYCGASIILISSASSKTAFCLAYLLRKRRSETITNIVGLTSKKNLEFTRHLGLYTDIYEYESFLKEDLFKEIMSNWLYVDVAGNDELNAKISGHFPGTTLVGKVTLGYTTLMPSVSAVSKVDWGAETSAPEQSKGAVDFEHFFTPTWLQQRQREMSVAEIVDKQKTAWTELMRDCVGWVNISRFYGAAVVENMYRSIARSGMGPEIGHIWSLRDNEEEAAFVDKRMVKL